MWNRASRNELNKMSSKLSALPKSTDEVWEGISEQIKNIEGNGTIYANKGVVFPLEARNSKRNVAYEDGILDIVVHYADSDALYKIVHISKDNTAWGDPLTFVQITKSTDGGDTWNQIFGRGHADFPNNQTGVKSHIIKHSSFNEIFTITLDWDAFVTGSNNESIAGGDFIISPIKYFFRSASNSNSVNDLGESIIVNIDGRTIAIKQRLSDKKNLIVEYDKLKMNDFHEVSRLIEQSNTAKDSDFTGEVKLTNNTDWISPYGLRAVNNPTSDSAGNITVGGAHGTEGGSGFPTGRFGKYVSIKLDGVTVSNGTHKGQKMELIVEHYVSGSNVVNKITGAKRDTMKETRTYNISSGEHTIHVELTALENLELTRYAGLQLTQPDYYHSMYRYKNGEEGILPVGGLSSGFHYSKEKDVSKLDRAVLYNDDSMLVMITDREYGVGDGSLMPAHSNENDQSPIYISGGRFGKIYAHNLGRNDNNVTLQVGESIFYRGGYHFVENTSTIANVFEYTIDGVNFTDDLRVI